ncbi:MAG: betaine-aldehyde dehydrogenase [Nitratireductor sp.]|nr:betaine-aldehyde dehydrogenase [Nitratireductor sp.]
MSQFADLLPPLSHFINGRFVTGEGAAVADVHPATNEAFCDIRWATDAEIEEAVAAAKAGFEVWRRTRPAERARILYRTAQILRERNDAIARLETLDTGKALQETTVVDVISAIDALEYFAAHAATMNGEHVAFGGMEGDWGYTVREPLGVCVGIAAWNYPMQMAGWKSAPALACGNAMILKPSETTPLSALCLAQAYKEAGLPDGVFNVLQGDGRVGAALIGHPDVAKVSLTGSSATGSKILAAAAPGLKKVTLELGGKSPLVVFDDADIDSAVGGAMLANFYSTGQVCSNGTRVFVHEKIRDRFAEKLIRRTEAMIVGDPFDMATQMGPLVSRPHFDKVAAYYRAAPEQGECLHDGGFPEIQGFENGNWVGPAIYAPKDDDQPIAREEIFGPLLSLFTFRDEDEVLSRANDTIYGLAAGVYTQDLGRAHRMMQRMKAGSCWINTFNVTPVEMPFGGHKQSGLGMENGKWALDAYSQVKSVHVAMGPMQYPY